MIPSHSQENRYDVLCRQLSRIDLVCILTALDLLLHFLLLAPLCYHLQFLRKHQPLIYLLLSKHKLLNCCPRKILVRFKNLFVTVPPAWLEITSTFTPKCRNLTARSPTTPILNQYCKLVVDRTINFVPFYTIATFLYLFYYMHHYFLLRNIALLIHCGRFSLMSSRQFTPDFLQMFTKRLQKNQKYFCLLCNSKGESRIVNYDTGQIKGRRVLKGP